VIQFNQNEMITKRSVLSFAGALIDEIKEEEGIVYVTFKEENTEQQQIDIWVVQLTKDQFSQVRREIDIQPISNQQLRAIHAKEDEKERKQKVADLMPIVTPEVEVTISTPSAQSKIVLPTEKQAPLNWKDKSCEQEARKSRQKLDEPFVSSMLQLIFRWHSKNDYSKHRNANHSLSHLLKKTIPGQFKLPFENCRRIYCAQSYAEWTTPYKNNWKRLVKDLKDKGYHDAIPPYLLKHYGSN
jgi:hypothetical protein|tara:strand:+ start:204 stop:929 length:726 start_codon:yes stop_codon:yes gene_type:complete